MSARMEVRKNHGTGLGVFATEHIRQGDLIVEETTVVVSSKHLPGPNHTWRDTMLDMRNDNLEARHVEEAMNKLSKETVEAFRATYKNAKSDLQRFQIISYDLCPDFGGPPSAFAATPVGPYVNHSCVGNLQYSWDEVSGTVHLLALEDIAPGDQLFLSYYIDGEWFDSEDRKAELHLIYDFACDCPLCSQSERSAASDDRRKSIRPLQAKLRGYLASGKPSEDADKASQLANQYIEAVEQELGGISNDTMLPFRADVRLAAAYLLAAKCKENPADAQELQRKAAKISQICFGSNSTHVAMQGRFFTEFRSVPAKPNV